MSDLLVAVRRAFDVLESAEPRATERVRIRQQTAAAMQAIISQESPEAALKIPPAAELLITMTVAIDRSGNVYQDTQTHGNSFADVYRGTCAIGKEVERLIAERRTCPLNPAAQRDGTRS